ncbi:MAG TPA: FkbM family methyltransferase [Vicinamibacterales bacterium]|nr:FkbM family methyltransferase [Vicinamibacterales bacterium]
MTEQTLHSWTPRVWLGESLRWYLTRARHPFKNYVVGHYWPLFCKPRIWISYDQRSVINVCLGEYMQQRIFFDGYYERSVIEWLKHTLRPGDVMWDVGANIGALSLVAARLCRRVVAFEPDPRCVARLNRNVAMNAANNVVVLPVALTEHTGRASFYQSAEMNTGMSSVIAGRLRVATPMDVDGVRADELLAAHPDLRPTIMKIDVEGAEHLVLRGAAQLLSTRQVRAIVFEDRRDEDGNPTNAGVLDVLNSTGYAIRPLGLSDPETDDGMQNFVATLTDAAQSH